MAEIAINRYVDSLYEIAKEDHIEQELLYQLNQVVDIFLQNEDFYYIMKSRFYKKEEKKNLLSEIFSERVHEYLLNFIKILIDNGRIGMLEDIRDAYKKRYYADENIREFEVITSIPMTSIQKDNLISQLKKIIQAKEVYLINYVDPAIIGGMKLKSNDVELDQSITTMLKKMKQQLQEKMI